VFLSILISSCGGSSDSHTQGNSSFVAVGDAGTIVTSTDGITWTSRNSGTTNSLSGVAYGNGSFVTVGDAGTIVTSTDGITWTSRNSGTTNSLSGVAYGNGSFVAVGDAGTIVTSTDGITWTSRNSGTTNSLSGVAYGNGSFVTVGPWITGDSGVSLTSTDGGMTWTSGKLVGSSSALSVTYGNSTFVAGCELGAILTSGDEGVTWKVTYHHDLPPYGPGHESNFITAATYGNDIFLVLPFWGGVLTSSDGMTWASVDASVDQGNGHLGFLYSIVHGNGSFVAVGDAGRIVTTTDDITIWTSRNSGVTSSLHSVAYGKGSPVSLMPPRI
jgi:photosystem II stability/assembly factor-like uncharacterized protein